MVLRARREASWSHPRCRRRPANVERGGTNNILEARAGGHSSAASVVAAAHVRALGDRALGSTAQLRVEPWRVGRIAHVRVRRLLGGSTRRNDRQRVCRITVCSLVTEGVWYAVAVSCATSILVVTVTAVGGRAFRRLARWHRFGRAPAAQVAQHPPDAPLCWSVGSAAPEGENEILDFERV